MLAYTMNKLLTQQAPIERDEGALDEFGGEPKAERRVVATLRCRFWWWKEGSSRSSSKEYATPSRSIHFTGGGILVEKGADIQDGDWVQQIEDPRGNVIVAGPFRVVAVQEYDEHTEAALMRP